MQNVIEYLKIKTKFKIKKQFIVKIIKIYRNLMKLINFMISRNRINLCQLKRSQKQYRRINEFIATFQFECSEFINALIVFIRKKRKTSDELTFIENEQYK